MRLLIMAFLLSGVFHLEADPFNYSHMRALAMIESGDDPTAKGKKGERTAYQIRPQTWKEFTQFPFSPKFYHNRVCLTNFFINYIQSVNKRFRADTGYNAPSRMQFYAIWNMGYEGFKKHGFNIVACPVTVQRRVMRFENLCYLYESQN